MNSKSILKRVLQDRTLLNNNGQLLKAYLSDFNIPKREINVIICIISCSYFDSFYSNQERNSEYEKNMLFNNVIEEYALEEKLLKECIDNLEFALSTKNDEYAVNKVNKVEKADKEEIDVLVLKASGADPEDKFNLAETYENEKPRNLILAAKFYKEAAIRGHVGAQLAMARFYEDGLGVGRNYEKAFYWYSIASNTSHEAQLKVGSLYYHGLGVKKSFTEAFKCFLASAENGNSSGQYMVGECYHQGIGTKKDSETAIQWFIKSAENNSAAAEAKLGIIYMQSTSQDNQRESAFFLIESAAQKQHALAMLTLGFFYAEGLFVDKNEITAFDYFEKAYSLDDRLIRIVDDFTKTKKGMSVREILNRIDELMFIYNT